MKQIPLSTIGRIANKVLREAREFQIMGVSSKGLFLSNTTRWIIFISSEIFRGPLTLTLTSHPGFFQAARPNQKVRWNTDLLTFDQTGYQLDLSAANIWKPNTPPPDAGTISIDRMTATLLEVNDPVLTKFLNPVLTEDPGTSRIDDLILEIYHGLRADRLPNIKQAAEKLIGSGSGLTPEGDDFIIGLILSLKLSPSNLFTQQTELLFSNLVESAYRKTTIISANLMECAIAGQADERLIAVYNALRYGINDGRQEIKNLLNWGNTSGRMALLGISAGILATI